MKLALAAAVCMLFDETTNVARIAAFGAGLVAEIAVVPRVVVAAAVELCRLTVVCTLLLVVVPGRLLVGPVDPEGPCWLVPCEFVVPWKLVVDCGLVPGNAVVVVAPCAVVVVVAVGEVVGETVAVIVVVVVTRSQRC